MLYYSIVVYSSISSVSTIVVVPFCAYLAQASSTALPSQYCVLVVIYYTIILLQYNIVVLLVYIHDLHLLRDISIN